MYDVYRDKCSANFVYQYPKVLGYSDLHEQTVGMPREELLKKKLKFERLCEDHLCPMYRVLWLEGAKWWELLRRLHPFVCTLSEKWCNSEMSLLGDRHFQSVHDDDYVGDVCSTLVNGSYSCLALKMPGDELGVGGNHAPVEELISSEAAHEAAEEEKAKNKPKTKTTLIRERQRMESLKTERISESEVALKELRYEVVFFFFFFFFFVFFSYFFCLSLQGLCNFL